MNFQKTNYQKNRPLRPDAAPGKRTSRCTYLALEIWKVKFTKIRGRVFTVTGYSKKEKTKNRCSSEVIVRHFIQCAYYKTKPLNKSCQKLTDWEIRGHESDRHTFPVLLLLIVVVVQLSVGQVQIWNAKASAGLDTGKLRLLILRD